MDATICGIWNRPLPIQSSRAVSGVGLSRPAFYCGTGCGRAQIFTKAAAHSPASIPLPPQTPHPPQSATSTNMCWVMEKPGESLHGLSGQRSAWTTTHDERRGRQLAMGAEMGLR